MNHKIPEEPCLSEKTARLPTLAGTFYPSEPERLKKILDLYFEGTVPSKSNPKGILVPHAGYIYSGSVAAVSYGRISPDFDGTFVIIGTSHRGYPNSVSDLDWETPIGKVLADKEFSNAISLPKNNRIFHIQENSIEVQMPFIAYRFPNAKVCTILMGDQSYIGVDEITTAVLSAISKTNREIIVVASCDCSHYIPVEDAEADDLACLAALKKLNIDKFYDALNAKESSMCGYGCLAATAEIGKALGATKSKVLTYKTSGDSSGDYRDVVGYASLEVI